MFIVNQKRTHVAKMTNVWLNEESNGKRKIGVGYGFAQNEEFWNNMGEYESQRAKEVFEELINNIGNVEKFYMPIE